MDTQMQKATDCHIVPPLYMYIQMPFIELMSSNLDEEHVAVLRTKERGQEGRWS
jgi:hypothetical protein